MIKPIIRWVGGKSAMLPHIEPPPLYNRYIEPFAGGLANYLSLPYRPDKPPAILCDSNYYLMNFYHHLSGHLGANRVAALATDISILVDDYAHTPDQPKWYYQRRDEMNQLIRDWDMTESNTLRMAVLFYVINRLSYNGLWRVNRNGALNVPHDKSKTKVLYDPAHIAAVHKKLYATHLYIGDFEEATHTALEMDWVFADPPYYDVYNQYTADTFSHDEHVRLAATMHDLDRRGVHFTLTNRDCPEVRELYQGFHMKVITQNNNINSKASGRKGGRVDLIITNFEVPND